MHRRAHGEGRVEFESLQHKGLRLVRSLGQRQHHGVSRVQHPEFWAEARRRRRLGNRLVQTTFDERGEAEDMVRTRPGDRRG